ncbi:MAG: 23S rRNA (pseudouridine(1915)-N(3))-methyltransferase RlmH [Rhodospirillales bacterium]|nr:23S rRNA (pseudouridine(1915)-N(3))-methyltransferase RlmH [Rhodospirillales bacterium]
MRVTLAAVGRWGETKGGPERALFDRYVDRLGLRLDLKEVDVKKVSGPGLRAAEGEKLLAQIPKNATVVALDVKGLAVDSEGLAKLLSGWRNRGLKDLAFVIGGADGLDPAVLARAELRLSLGPLTWPHLLVRAMLAEQLYRAQCILDGHPYHRG